MKLTDLPLQVKSTITDMTALTPEFLNRLLNMGVYPKAEVVISNIIARGSMYVLTIDDVEICLRKKDAEKIIVK